MEGPMSEDKIWEGVVWNGPAAPNAKELTEEALKKGNHYIKMIDLHLARAGILEFRANRWAKRWFGRKIARRYRRLQKRAMRRSWKYNRRLGALMLYLAQGKPFQGFRFEEE